jgi:hypothetical protein
MLEVKHTYFHTYFITVVITPVPCPSYAGLQDNVEPATFILSTVGSGTCWKIKITHEVPCSSTPFVDQRSAYLHHCMPCHRLMNNMTFPYIDRKMRHNNRNYWPMIPIGLWYNYRKIHTSYTFPSKWLYSSVLQQIVLSAFSGQQRELSLYRERSSSSRRKLGRGKGMRPLRRRAI